MLYFALAFLGGNACLLLLTHLPALLWLIILLAISLCASFFVPAFLKRWLILFAVFLASFCWAVFSAQRLLNQKIPEELLNQPVTVAGLIDTIPEYKDKQVSLTLKIEQIRANNIIFIQPYRIRLTWYFPPYNLRVGEKWQLQARLKSAHYYANPGSFDYQAWLFEQRIVATGYVQTGSQNRLIAELHYLNLIDHVREKIANNIQHALSNQSLIGLIQALAVGVRSNITEEQWDILRGTGTNHLFAIAGLHIGFVSGFIYLLFGFIWRRLGRVSLFIPTPVVAVLAALISAILYSALAGFSLPTQRAIIMTAVFLLATLVRKKIPLWHSWSTALILVLIYDPLAVLSASFWMSFNAVALIIYGITGRLYRKNIWRHLLYPQWVISIGLIPICLLFFQQYSLASFIANAIAIPWIGFLVLPLSLLGGITSLLSPVIGKLILLAAERLLALIWLLLSIITKMAWLQWHVYITNFWIFFTATIAVILILMPRGLPGRWLSILWMLPLLIWKPASPENNEIWLNILNVNAGMVVIAHTSMQTVVYESSIKPFTNQNTVVPYLQYAGINHIDVLITNNASSLSLLDLIPVKQVFLNAKALNVTGNVVECDHEARWQSADINFSVIPNTGESSNHLLCALKIQHNNFISLITDGVRITKTQTMQANMLITSYKNNIPDLTNILQTVQPEWIILSGQYSEDSRLHENDVRKNKVYSTADSGTIKVLWPDNSAKIKIINEMYHQHFWNQ